MRCIVKKKNWIRLILFAVKGYFWERNSFIKVYVYGIFGVQVIFFVILFRGTTFCIECDFIFICSQGYFLGVNILYLVLLIRNPKKLCLL